MDMKIVPTRLNVRRDLTDRRSKKSTSGVSTIQPTDLRTRGCLMGTNPADLGRGHVTYQSRLLPKSGGRDSDSYSDNKDERDHNPSRPRERSLRIAHSNLPRPHFKWSNQDRSGNRKVPDRPTLPANGDGQIDAPMARLSMRSTVLVATGRP
jgi:hypothetical protein